MIDDDAMAAPSEAKIKDLADAAQRLQEIAYAIEQTETLLQSLSEKHRKITEEEIPQKMLELGMKSFALDDGSTVDVKPFYDCRITPENQDDAFAFLRRTGNGSLIKNVVTLSFGKGEDDLAAKVKAMLAEQKLDFTEATSVHAQTLKAFVKETVETNNGMLQIPEEPDPEKASVPLPHDLFKVYVGTKAVIKSKKAKGQKEQ